MKEGNNEILNYKKIMKVNLKRRKIKIWYFENIIKLFNIIINDLIIIFIKHNNPFPFFLSLSHSLSLIWLYYLLLFLFLSLFNFI